MNRDGCQSAVRLLSFGMRVWRDRRFRLIFGPLTRGARFGLKSVGTATLERVRTVAGMRNLGWRPDSRPTVWCG